jgi:Ceramidase
MVRFNIFDISRRRAVIIISTGILFTIVIWLLNSVLPVRGIWDHFYTEKEIGTFFCEQTDMENAVRQPVNTFSNFIYLLAAVAILHRGWKDRTKRNRYNIISANPYYSFLLGGILLYIFGASVFFHASLIHFASELDFSAVYSLTLFPLMYFVHRVWLFQIGLPSNTRHPRSTWTLIILFGLAYLCMTLFLKEGMRDQVVLGLIIALIFFGFIVEKRDPGKTNHYYLLTAVISILIAVMWFIFDTKKIFCQPGSYLQPHSLWHFFSGTAAFYFYMYIRSEKNKI